MIRAKLGTIAIAVYFVITPAAAAAEITRRAQANGPDVITINGVIEAGDYWKFIEITGDLKQAVVILNSRGGNVGQAAYIGALIRDRNFETRVHNGAVCNSACTFIWLAGTSRHLDRSARLGFHSVSKPNAAKGNQLERYEPGNVASATYMAILGVPQQVIELQRKADPCCLNYIDHAHAKAWGLLNDRSVKQQAPALVPVTLPSGSMLPTVPVGGLVLIKPLLPIEQLQIGDVVTFYGPKDKSAMYVKRIVGMGGDRIQMIGGVLNINGQAVKRERVEDFMEEDVSGKPIPIKRWRETLPNGVSYTTLDLVDNGFYDNTPIYHVPAGHFFMMGDNRDNSTDSRVLSQVGYVPVENIAGKAHSFLPAKLGLP